MVTQIMENFVRVVKDVSQEQVQRRTSRLPRRRQHYEDLGSDMLESNVWMVRWLLRFLWCRFELHAPSSRV